MKIWFVVYGEAQPAGSKRAFLHKQIRRLIVTDANPAAKIWKDRVAKEAGAVMAGKPLLAGPLRLRAGFFRPRPASHLGTGRNEGKLKPGAPTHPIVKPDTTKLVRGLEDAMTGIVYRDDAQIVEQHAYKSYGEPARVVVEVSQLQSQQLGLGAVS